MFDFPIAELITPEEQVAVARCVAIMASRDEDERAEWGEQHPDYAASLDSLASDAQREATGAPGGAEGEYRRNLAPEALKIEPVVGDFDASEKKELPLTLLAQDYSVDGLDAATLVAKLVDHFKQRFRLFVG